MAEWPIAAVLKTVKPKGFGGSNPSSSAIFMYGSQYLSSVHQRRVHQKLGFEQSSTEGASVTGDGSQGRSRSDLRSKPIPLPPPFLCTDRGKGFEMGASLECCLEFNSRSEISNLRSFRPGMYSHGKALRHMRRLRPRVRGL